VFNRHVPKENRIKAIGIVEVIMGFMFALFMFIGGISALILIPAGAYRSGWREDRVMAQDLLKLQIVDIVVCGGTDAWHRHVASGVTAGWTNFFKFCL
jgi:hypothetical protein